MTENRNMKCMYAILLVVLTVGGGLGMGAKYEHDKAENFRLEAIHWQDRAKGATSAFVKSHNGIIPKGTRVESTDDGKSIIVVGFEPVN